jgi:hypothetical protein
VEELWSRALLFQIENRRQKPTRYCGGVFLCVWHRGTFLSQAGPRVVRVFLKLGITSLVLGCES